MLDSDQTLDRQSRSFSGKRAESGREEMVRELTGALPLGDPGTQHIAPPFVMEPVFEYTLLKIHILDKDTLRVVYYKCK